MPRRMPCAGSGPRAGSGGLLLAACVAALGIATCAAAAEPEPDGAGDGAAARLEGMREQAAAYELASEAGSEALDLRPEPLLRWTNVTRQSDDGALFLWTRNGRPQAALCVYTLGEGHYHHELQSLSERPLTGRWRGEADWSPREPGVAWTDVPGTPPVADIAARRLPQMRGLARRFSATIVDRLGDDSPEQLRLLPQPLYRYVAEPDVVDGAVFAFAQGTDPEVLLLLEAADSGGGGRPRWRYALARLSSTGMEARYERAEGNEGPVWSVSRWTGWNAPDPGEPYMNVRRGGQRPGGP